MLANLVKSIFPGNSPPTFEQARLQATYDGDTNPPLEKDLTIILTAFQDKNPDIRGAAAFYLTLATMQANKAAKPWNYILKNFILFDKAMDEKCFAKEISELELEQLGNYKPTSGKQGEKLDLLLKRYFRYLKAKGRIFYTKHFHFNVSNERQKSDLTALSSDKLFLETKRLRSLIILAFDVFASGIQEITKYKLNQFIFTLVLNTLTKIFGLQKLIFSILYDSMSSLQSNRVLELYEAIKEYMIDVESLTSHCNTLNNIPGFQISQEQIFDPKVGTRMLKKLSNHLADLNKSLSAATPKAPEISFSFHIESTVPQHRGDELITEAEDHHSWEDVQRLSVRSGEGYSSPIRVGSPRVRTPKSVTKTFKESFDNGFKYSINSNVKVLSRLDTREDVIGRNRKDTRSLTKLSDEFVPGLFDDLLCLEESDDLFDRFNNFYSADYADIPKVEANPRVINRYDEEEAKRASKGHAYHHRNFVKRISFDVAEIEDFDQELFDNYKNNYSSDC